MPKEIEVNVQEVMDRKKIANSINTLLDTGIGLLKKKKYDPDDQTRLRVMKQVGTAINSGVAMVQQETAQLRAAIINSRLKQLGYTKEPPKQVN
jgi:hypothetical protein